MFQFLDTMFQFADTYEAKGLLRASLLCLQKTIGLSSYTLTGQQLTDPEIRLRDRNDARSI